MDLNSIGNQAIELIREVGVFISNERKSFSKERIENKGVNDFVSYVDKEAEKKLVTGLKKILPSSGFITEEKTATHSNEEYIWIIDPLDGTTNFIHNLAPHAISVALQYKNETMLGIVYELGADEMFYSWKGINVFCNKTQISVSESSNLSEGLIATGFHTNKFECLQHQLLVVSEVVRVSHGIRRHGSAATDLAYVAAGRFDGFFEQSLSAWDVAAGAFLITQAGGSVTDYKGANNYIAEREIVAGTIGVHHDLLELILNAFSE
jgi:myo-inositol-1(or 4)-monophosphatase